MGKDWLTQPQGLEAHNFLARCEINLNFWLYYCGVCGAWTIPTIVQRIYLSPRFLWLLQKVADRSPSSGRLTVPPARILYVVGRSPGVCTEEEGLQVNRTSGNPKN